jgi:hypothetical protein
MRRKKTKPQVKSRTESKTVFGNGKAGYIHALRRGERLLTLYLQDKLPPADRIVFNMLYDYYSCPEVQQAIYKFAKSRKLTLQRAFRCFMPAPTNPDDILPLAFAAADLPLFWPALHATITRYNGVKAILKDFVLDLDFKSDSWQAAFEAALPIVRRLHEFGVTFFVKFSGNISLHLIIPAEVFPTDAALDNRLREQILSFVRRLLPSPRCLDMSFFTLPDHFLRLPYSMNEHTGLVSIPIPLDDYEFFHPQWAIPEEVWIWDDWWQIPPGAVEHTINFGKFLERSTFSRGSA